MESTVPAPQPGAPRKILVGIDGSPGSLHALEIAARMAALSGGELVLAHVLQPAQLPEDVPRAGGGPREQEAADRRFGEHLLAQATEAVPLPPSLPITRVILHGPPAEALLDAAATSGADLLVLGRRGRGNVRRLLGSVSRRVVSRSTRPVLVVR